MLNTNTKQTATYIKTLEGIIEEKSDLLIQMEVQFNNDTYELQQKEADLNRVKTELAQKESELEELKNMPKLKLGLVKLHTWLNNLKQ